MNGRFVFTLFFSGELTMCSAVSVRFVVRAAVVAAVALAMGMAASQASATYIVASDFNQEVGAVIDTIGPNIANLPGAASWFQTGEVGGNAYGFNKIAMGAFTIDSTPSHDGDTLSTSPVDALGLNNGTAISIASAGSYVKPTNMRVQGDIRSGLTDGTDTTYGRGVGLGFFDATGSSGQFALGTKGFTGLVLAHDGGLYVYQGNGLYGQGTASGKVPFAGGTFDTAAYYTLAYDVNTDTGSISNISLSGSTADYSGLTSSAFTDAATANLGFFASAESWGCYGFVDNVALGEVPEPSTIMLLATGLVGLLAYAWRKRR
jgi:hypothetical protein